METQVVMRSSSFPSTQTLIYEGKNCLTIPGTKIELPPYNLYSFVVPSGGFWGANGACAQHARFSGVANLKKNEIDDAKLKQKNRWKRGEIEKKKNGEITKNSSWKNGEKSIKTAKKGA